MESYSYGAVTLLLRTVILPTPHWHPFSRFTFHVSRSMCLGVFLAADRELPLVAWDEAQPSFNVTPLQDEERPVRGRFSKRNVYYLGAYTGCSCGFTPDEDGEEADAARSLEGLVAYLREAVGDGSLELFTCWDGDWLEPAARQLVMTPEDFADPETWFDELTFVSIRATHD